uniref:Uncharacterized protein n=1 Tax=Strigamia maritima TaxID=126957 RepID=T1JIX9_STRMM
MFGPELDQSGGADTMLPIGVRIKVRTSTNLRKRSSGAATTSKKATPVANKTPRQKRKKQVPPARKFLRTSKDRAAKLAKKEAKKQASEEHQYHVLSRRPAWADDQGVFYGIYGSYYHQKIQQRKDNKYVESEDMSEETKMKLEEEQNKASQAHKRWLKKNKVTDAIAGKLGRNNVQNKKSASQKYRVYKHHSALALHISHANVNANINKYFKDEGGLQKKTKINLLPRDGGAGILLYVGFFLTVIGLILTVLGAGEDGFRSAELGLIGPSLIGMGAFFAFLRVLTCTCHHRCARLCPRFCPPPSKRPTDPTTLSSADKAPLKPKQKSKPTLIVASADEVHIQPTLVASAQPIVDAEAPPVLVEPESNPAVEGAALATGVATGVDAGLNDVIKVSFENEINNDDCASVDIDLTEFEEVELNSPESSTRFKKRFFEPVDKSEIVLDPMCIGFAVV